MIFREGLAALGTAWLFASPAIGSPLLLDNFNTDATGTAPNYRTTSTPSGTITVSVAALNVGGSTENYVVASIRYRPAAEDVLA